MIKETRPAYYAAKRNAEWCGKSTDTLPKEIANGDEFYAIDKGKWYVYDGTTNRLVEDTTRGGSGGGGTTDISLGITGATVGQIIKIATVTSSLSRGLAYKPVNDLFVLFFRRLTPKPKSETVKTIEIRRKIKVDLTLIINCPKFHAGIVQYRLDSAQFIGRVCGHIVHRIFRTEKVIEHPAGQIWIFFLQFRKSLRLLPIFNAPSE